MLITALFLGTTAPLQRLPVRLWKKDWLTNSSRRKRRTRRAIPYLGGGWPVGWVARRWLAWRARSAVCLGRSPPAAGSSHPSTADTPPPPTDRPPSAPPAAAPPGTLILPPRPRIQQRTVDPGRSRRPHHRPRLNQRREECPLFRVRNFGKRERMTKVVCICHPFRLICVAVKRDYVPLASHLLLPAYIDEATERDLALEHGFALLRGADEMWVCAKSVSEGMAGEIAEALLLGVPVYRIDVGWLLVRSGHDRYAKVRWEHAPATRYIQQSTQRVESA